MSELDKETKAEKDETLEGVDNDYYNSDAQSEQGDDNQTDNPAKTSDSGKSRGIRFGRKSKSKEREEELLLELAELKDKHLRLFSEFDNFRKRTQREKADLLKMASADLLTALLPVLDDFERANKSMSTATDIVALKEGVELIYNKFSNLLIQKGLEPMNSMGKDFDTDLHEAITNIPAPSEDLKGKVVDVVEKGYTLQGKVLRYAKVVVGS